MPVCVCVFVMRSIALESHTFEKPHAGLRPRARAQAHTRTSVYINNNPCGRNSDASSSLSTHRTAISSVHTPEWPDRKRVGGFLGAPFVCARACVPRTCTFTNHCQRRATFAVRSRTRARVSRQLYGVRSGRLARMRMRVLGNMRAHTKL